ncbi:hypothetical protein SAMN06298226_1720 [Nitrosovibrio sp. Nv4]|nr:hypothetical protein SAMN06298226_1720 [Nitrosovibrio sp. Nv4]
MFNHFLDETSTMTALDRWTIQAIVGGGYEGKRSFLFRQNMVKLDSYGSGKQSPVRAVTLIGCSKRRTS